MARKSKGTWYVSFELPPGKRGHARVTETFPNEFEAKKFARAKLVDTPNVSAGTLNPHLPKRTIAATEMLIFLKITCSCLARERTAVSVRLIRMPIALGLSPGSANLRSLSSSAFIHGRESKCSGSVIGPRAPRVKANQIQQISRCRRRANGLPPGRSGQDRCQSNRRRRPRA